MMRVLFAGTPSFAVPSLEALCRAPGVDLVGVLTQPDRPAGRGMTMTASPVKTLALSRGLTLLQPTTLKDANVWAWINAQHADLMVVAAYGLLLPEAVLSAPRYGCINVHASLLPRWRGAAPVHRAILAGDKETGVTLMAMDVGLDTGDMLASRTTPIYPSDDSASLSQRLADLGAELLIATIDAWPVSATRQPTAGVSYAHKISKHEANIDWHASAAQIERQIRAFRPLPGASSLWQRAAGETLSLKLLDAIVLPDAPAVAAGAIWHADGDTLCVRCGEGSLQLLRLQLAGGKPLAVADFVRGRKFTTADTLQTAVALPTRPRGRLC